jgi:exodeoxyribonuclease VII large subunit
MRSADGGSETCHNAPMDVESPSTNALEWSVSELAGALKRTVEDQFGHVRVRGEISGYRGPHSSGHVYFSLKDANAKIDAVIWKGVFGRLKTRPEEGLEVIATGKMTTFPGKSSYQIVIDHLELAGLGALMALLEQRRRQLAAEGLFDEARKRPLPYLPEVIGVVTSPTGAVIRDILHRLEERFPRRVLVWPVRVQGETSAAEVAAAIKGFNALPPGGPIPRPDVLIVARGGGSLEDLMGFNEEIVVRAAAASTIPLIAAVGHETDWTLIDHVADLRAPTPTAAAEKAAPVRADLLAATADLARRQGLAWSRLMEQRRQALRLAARALPTGEALLAPQRQRLDAMATRLPAALARNARVHEQQLAQIAARLARHAPQARLALARQRIADFGVRLRLARQRLGERERERLAKEAQTVAALEDRALRALRLIIERRKGRLETAVKLFDSVNHKAVLRRGFALVTDSAGKPVVSVAAAPPGTRLTLGFADGSAPATVDGTPAKPVAPRKSAPQGGQGGLFD